MKIFEVVSPSQVDEIAFTKTGAAKQAAKKAVATEVKRIERAILAKMAGAGDKQITLADLENYLTQAGYGKFAQAAINDFDTKAIQKKQSRDAMIGKAKGAVDKVKGVFGKARDAYAQRQKQANIDAGLESTNEGRGTIRQGNGRVVDRKTMRAIIVRAVQLGFKNSSGSIARGRFASR